MSITATRSAYAAALAEALTGTTIKVHGGQFSADELRRWGVQAPAVLVAALGLAGLERIGGRPRADVEWVAAVLVKSTPDRDRNEAALELTERVVATIARVAPDDTDRATQISARNGYSRELDANGVAMWVVSWRARQDLSQDLPDLPEFRATTATWMLGQVEAAIDDIDQRGSEE